MKRVLSIISFFVLLSCSGAVAAEDDLRLRAMGDELNRTMKKLRLPGHARPKVWHNKKKKESFGKRRTRRPARCLIRATYTAAEAPVPHPRAKID